MDSAVIFDVDGVLLDLTRAEEDGFFLAFERRYGLTGLSRNWDSYRCRNDHDIIDEILADHGLPALDRDGVIAEYLGIMAGWLAAGRFAPVAIPGASALLASLGPFNMLGVATANLIAAARIRLAAAGMWGRVAGLAFGAEGGGHKRQTLARAITATGLPRQRIVYVGDNLNDVDAGLANGVHFIGFARDAEKRRRLAEAGAPQVSGDHETTLALVNALLRAGGQARDPGAFAL